MEKLFSGSIGHVNLTTKANALTTTMVRLMPPNKLTNCSTAIVSLDCDGEVY